MSLQSKTFSWGSFAYQSESRSYILELTLTEHYTDQVNNLSNIGYKLVLKSGSNNRFTGQIDSVIKLNNAQVASGSKQITAAYNSSWVLLEGTENVTHDQDGSLNMPITVSIDTYNSYAPPDKTLDWSWKLTSIPRASSFGTITGTTLGGRMRVNINRSSTSFSHTVYYYLGNDAWSGGASGDEHAEFDLPMSLAEQSTDSPAFDLRLLLRTYNGDTQIGGDVWEHVSVTIPENEDTKPVVMLQPVAVGDFNGLYLQNRTKVKMDRLSATGRYGAEIRSYSFRVDGRSYAAEEMSKTLTECGTIKIVGSAVDSRGFTGTVEQEITVLPYYRPRLNATAWRCRSDGTEDDAGQFLKIRATVDFATLDGKNSAALWYRYRPESGEYGGEAKLAEGLSDRITVETEPPLDGLLLREKAYSVQIIVRDATGEEAVATMAIACEQIFKHKRAGGKGLGLGGYCERDDLLDVHWDTRMRKNVRVDGFLAINDSVGAKNFNGIYMCRAEVSDSNTISIQSKFIMMEGVGHDRQSIFVFGFDNVTMVVGCLGIKDDGTVSWSGTENVTASADTGSGRVDLRLQYTAWDYFALLSAEPFSILEE